MNLIGRNYTLDQVYTDFLDEKSDTEDSFLTERLHNPMQYSYYCDDLKLSEIIFAYLTKFWRLKQKIVRTLEEDNENYDEYEEKTLLLAEIIESFDTLLVMILLNLVSFSPDVVLNRRDVIDIYIQNNNDRNIQYDHAEAVDFICNIMQEGFKTNIELKMKQIEENKVCTSAVY